MKDERKTKRQLIDELTQLRQQLSQERCRLSQERRQLAEAPCRADGLETRNQDNAIRQRMEELLRASVEQWCTIFNTMSDAICLLDSQGRIQRCNRAMVELIDRPLGEVLGRRCWEVVLGTSEPLDECPVVRMWESLSRESLVMSLGDRWFDVSVDPLLADDGQSIGAVSVMTDITERKQAEEAMWQTKDNLARAQEIAHLGNWNWDVQNNTLTWSDEVYRIFGVDRDFELTYENIEAMVHPDDRKLNQEKVDELLAGADSVEYGLRIVRPDGAVRHIHQNAQVSHDAACVVSRIFGTMLDITERKRAEEERQTHLWFLEGLNQVNQAIQGTNDLEQMMSDVLDVVLSVLDCDRASLVYPCDPEAATWQAPMERTKPEWPGALTLGLEVPMDPEVARVFKVSRITDGPVVFGPGCKEPLPTEIAVQFNIQSQITMALYPKIDKPWNFVIHQCSHPRIWTQEERKLFKEIGRRLTDGLTSLLMFRSLRESEGKLTEAQRIAHVGYWEHDINTDCITWSDETYRIFGLRPQERILSPAQLEELLHPEDQQIMAQAVAEALRGSSRYDVEYRVIRPNGEVRVVHSQGDVTWDKSGRPLRMFGVVQDITERKRAAEQIAYQAQLLAIVNDAIVASDAQYRLTTWNAAAESMYGWKAEEVLGQFGLDVTRTEFPGVDKAEMLSTIAERGSWRGEATQARKDETRFPVEVSSVVLRDATGEATGFVSVNRDITERKQAEKALQQTRDNLARAQKIAHLGNWDWDVQNSRLTWSDEIYRIFGVDQDFELTFEGIEAMVHPDDRRMNQEKVDELLSGADSVAYELRIVRPDGAVRHIYQNAQVSLDGAGRVSRIFGIMLDITERKRAAEALAEQAEQLHLLSARLADVQEAERRRIARELHDQVGQNLTAMGINLNVLRPLLAKAPESAQSCLDDLLALVKETTVRIRGVMADLRPPELDDYGLLAALRWYAEQVGTRTGLEVVVEGEAIRPRLSSQQETALFRIAQEALNNVVKHAQVTRAVVTVEEGEELVGMTIADDGVGFDPASLDRVGAAPHWGLLTMRERAQAAGAHWRVESAPGQGTRVVVELARSQGDQQ